MSLPYRLHYAPDNASLIIRLVLEELRLPYQTVLVDRAKREQDSAAYRKLNPHGLIPVLETPQGPIFETGAILLWLADTHGRMAPTPDAQARGEFLKWLFFMSNTLHADMRLSFYPELYVGDDPAHKDLLRRQVQTRLAGHLARLEEQAATTPNWLGASAPSVLDYYVAGCLRWMALYPQNTDRGWFSLAATPHLQHLVTTLEARPATHAAQIAEGLGPTPFTAPNHATPPEGSAT